jgi:hypothetical protein
MALKVQVSETPTIECAKQYTPKNKICGIETRISLLYKLVCYEAR